MWIDDDGPPVHVGKIYNFFKEKFQFLALYCRKRKFYNPAYNLYGNLLNNLGQICSQAASSYFNSGKLFYNI